MQIQTKKFRLLLDILGLMKGDADVYPSEKGWMINMIDPQRVSMVHIAVSDAVFTDFEVWNPFTMDVAGFQKALKAVGESISLTLGDGRVDIVSDRLVQHVPIPVSGFHQLKIPEIKGTSASVMVDAEPLRRLLKVSDGFEYCTLVVDDEKLTFSAQNDHNSAEVTVPKDECISLSGAARSSYPLEYMQEFIGVIPKGEIPELRYSDDYPLTVEFGDKDFSVTWLVAPRIEYE